MEIRSRAGGAGTLGSRRYLVALALALTAGLFLAACASDNGVAKKAPTEILQASAAALRSVTSYQVQGKVPTGTGSTLGSFNFRVGGANLGEGNFALGTLKFQLTEIKKTVYIKSATLWEALDGGALQDLLANHWVSIPATSPYATALTDGVTSLTSAKSTAASMTKGAQAAKREGRITVDQQGAVKVVVSKKTTVFVATTGRPYPVRVTGTKGSYLDLSNFDTTFTIKAPKQSVSLLDVIAGVEAGVGGTG